MGLYDEPSGALAPATMNPMLYRQVQNVRAANPRPDVTDIFGYGPTWQTYFANAAENARQLTPEQVAMGFFGTAKPAGRPLAGKLGRMVDDDISPLLSAAQNAKSLDEFRRSFSQSHLTDLSNHEMHRFGRAISPYKGEPYTDLTQILADGSRPGSYLTTIKYEAPEVYRQITSPKETVTVYRAVPKNAGDSIRIGDYVALEERYARMHGESVLGAQQGVEWKLVKETVPKKDIVWGNADFNEWAYSPQRIRQQYPSLEDLYSQIKK